MKFSVITLFSETIKEYVGTSILGRAQAEGVFGVKYFDPREFTADARKTVDLRPFGGGPGMVMTAEPLLKAWTKAKGKTKKVKTILFAADGKPLTNEYARKLAKSYDQVILICGRYEGVDERVAKITKAEKISVGDYILTGGEVPAMALIDAVARQMPGTLGTFESLEDDRVAGSTVYTRPETLKWKGKNYKVPRVLLSGHHAKIEEWKKKKRGIDRKPL